MPSVRAALAKMILGHITVRDPDKREHISTPVYNERRFSHTHVIGKSRFGKSSALSHWFLQDHDAREGGLFIDPHGDAVHDILRYISPERADDVILLDFGDTKHPIPLNILANIPSHRRAFMADALVSIFKNLWGYAHTPTPQMDQYLFNAAYALMDVRGTNLTGIYHLLNEDDRYRKHIGHHTQNPVIKDFWLKDFPALPDKERRQSVLSTLNKVGMLIADPKIRNCIGQKRMSFNVREAMDTGKTVLVSVPQGTLGIEKSSLIGSLILALFHLTALERPEGERNPFHIYLDELYRFAPSLLAEMLSGIGKFGVSLTVAHQYLDQLPDELRHALIGTTGTTVSFRLGGRDAEFMSREFELRHAAVDTPITALAPFYAWVKSTEIELLSMPAPDGDIYDYDHRTVQRRRYAIPKHDAEEVVQAFRKKR